MRHTGTDSMILNSFEFTEVSTIGKSEDVTTILNGGSKHCLINRKQEMSVSPPSTPHREMICKIFFPLLAICSR